MAKDQKVSKDTYLVEPAWGYTIFSETSADVVNSGSFPKMLRPAHIYLKELWACVHVVETILQSHRNVHILLGVDNTAVVGAVRARYSSNTHGLELIKRLHQLLLARESTLDVVPLRSEDNAADAPSRGLPMNAEVRARCMSVITRFQEGKNSSRGTIRKASNLQWEVTT
jgi:hypothetical protein